MNLERAWMAATLLAGLLGCQAKPQPSPPPPTTTTTTVAPEPTPTPGPQCTIIPNGLMVATGLTDVRLKQVVLDAQARVGPVCGRDPDETHCRLAEDLVEARHLPALLLRREDGTLADGVMVYRESDERYEEWKVVYYGEPGYGCWLTKWKGVYERKLK